MRVIDILGKNYIDNLSEMEVLLYIATELSFRGETLDFQDVKADFSTYKPFQVEWFNELARKGHIKTSKEIPPATLETNNVLNFLKHLKTFNKFKNGLLFKEEGNELRWDEEFAKEYFGDNYLTVSSGQYIFQTIKWLVANHIVDTFQGEYGEFGITKNSPYGPKLTLDLSSTWHNSKDVFLDPFAATVSSPQLQQIYSFNLQNIPPHDLEWDLFCYNVINNKTFKRYSIQEKYDMLVSLGIQEGTVVQIANRVGQSQSSPLGRIGDLSLYIVKTLTHEYLEVLKIPSRYNFSLNELERDWNKIISEEGREFTKSMLVPKKEILDEEKISLVNLGVTENFFQEDKLLFMLNNEEIVTKEFGYENLTMNAPETVFALFKQWGIEFDTELFAKTYSIGFSQDFSTALLSIDPPFEQEEE